jgi:hypothetical protein
VCEVVKFAEFFDHSIDLKGELARRSDAHNSRAVARLKVHFDQMLDGGNQE